MSCSASSRSAGAGQVSELEQRVLYQARLGSNGFPPQARLRIQHARPADLGAQELTLLDVLEQARRVRRLLTTARAADPEDLNPPERGEAGDVNLTELDARVTKAENALKAAHKALDTLREERRSGAERRLAGSAAEARRLRLPGVRAGRRGRRRCSSARCAQHTRHCAAQGRQGAHRGSRCADRRARRRRASRAMRAIAGTDAHGLRLIVRCHAAVHVRQRRGAQEALWLRTSRCRAAIR